nr:Ppx/GppA phosphatase family protein [Acuticoccus kandeliae]
MPRGRRMGNGIVGVVDVGSNSVRLVLYEHACRAPTVLFNEKVLAALGEGLAETGRISDEAMGRALSAIRRFMAIARAADVANLTIVATAAARDASNGPDFIREIESIAGIPVRVLQGPEEATMAANGVLCGFWRADGLVGDLGGGSLELIDIGEASVGAGESFPLGTLRLKGDAKGSLPRGIGILDETLGASAQLPLLEGRPFYAVGGTWRSLVRLHMAETDYPISIMHHYTVDAQELSTFCAKILREGIDDMAHNEVVSKGRRGLLPWGAAALQAIITHGKPSAIIASALGVREGLLYSTLGEAEKRRDPLILATEELALLRSRSPQHSAELVEWSGAAFAALGISESEDEQRLRVAACLLSDIGWRAHPDYRGDQALAIVSNAALYGIDHPGRGFLALVLHDRYGGLANPASQHAADVLCTAALQERAALLAGIFRIAYVLAPGVPGILPRTRLLKEGDDLVISLPADLAEIDGERPLRRVRQLAKLVGASGSIRTERAQTLDA